MQTEHTLSPEVQTPADVIHETAPTLASIDAKLDELLAVLGRLVPLLDAVESSPMLKGMLG